VTMRSPAQQQPPADDVLNHDAVDLRWVARVWVLVAAFAFVAAIRSAQVGVPFRDPDGAFFLRRIAVSVGLFSLLTVVDAIRRTKRQNWSVGPVLATLRGRWARGRLALALSGLLAYHIVYFCYRNLKSWAAFNSIHDDLLQRVDRWLFFGHSPATLLHRLLGEHISASVLVAIYESFSYLVSVSLVAALVFVGRIRNGYVFVVSAMWVWVLGVGSYYLFPSIGPFHSAPEDFAQLPHTVVTDTQANYLAQREYLLHHPAANDAFAQLSAFASLHTAFTCLVLLSARYYRLRRLMWVMAGYLLATIVATIYLGWHFAVDDIAGIAIALLAVILGLLTVRPRLTPSDSADPPSDQRIEPAGQLPPNP
jgi:PAP2 superfamily